MQPADRSRGTPFWAWILVILGGCVLVSIFALGAFAVWLGGTDNKFMRTIYAQSNPDFAILQYIPKTQQIVVRHAATGKTFRVQIAAMKDNRIDYRTLATKLILTPDWAAYPGAKSMTGQPATTPDSQTSVMERFDELFMDHNFEVVNSTGGNRDYCNFETVECAILATTRSSRGETFYSTTFHGPP